MPISIFVLIAAGIFALAVLAAFCRRHTVSRIITILLANWVVPVLPYLLAFSAGAMLYVVVEELIPEMSEGEHSHLGVVFFAVGFTLMMVLDVALG